jgi:hypothetical protein
MVVQFLSRIGWLGVCSVGMRNIYPGKARKATSDEEASGWTGSHSLSCAAAVVTVVSISNTLICIHVASACCTLAYRSTGPLYVLLLSDLFL